MSDQDDNQQQAEPVDLFKDDSDNKDPEPSPQQPDPQAAVAQATDSYQELLAAITNENGEQKYKSVSDALVAASHAQEHIRRLEAQLEQATTQQQRSDIVDEIREALKTQQQPTSQPQSQQVDVREVFNQLLEERTQETSKVQNRQAVNAAMEERFGSKAEEAVKLKAQELGVSEAFLKSVGETSPKAFLEYFNAQTVGTPATPIPTQRPAASVPSEGLPTPPENIMVGASTKDLVSHWRSVKDHVNNQ